MGGREKVKRIAISQRLWRQLHRLKNQWGFTTIPRTIEYMINSQASLLQENLQVIHHLVDELMYAKNLEVKMVLPDIHARVDRGHKDPFTQHVLILRGSAPGGLVLRMVPDHAAHDGCARVVCLFQVSIVNIFFPE